MSKSFKAVNYIVPVVRFLELVFRSRIWEVAPEARSRWMFQNACIDFSHSGWVSMNFDIRQKTEGLEQLP